MHPISTTIPNKLYPAYFNPCPLPPLLYPLLPRRISRAKKDRSLAPWQMACWPGPTAAYAEQNAGIPSYLLRLEPYPPLPTKSWLLSGPF